MNLKHTFSGALLASAVALGASAASAAVIDFTAGPVSGGPILGGVTYTVAGVGGPLTTMNPYDGGLPKPANSFGLALDYDGYGVVDDEISTDLPDIAQSIVVTFSKPVRILGFAFLDLFENFTKDGYLGTGESGILTAGGSSVEISFGPVNGKDKKSGYSEATGLDIIATSVTFTVTDINDPFGVADGALAAIQVATVPVPAAGLLLLGGLGGLAALRRRKA